MYLLDATWFKVVGSLKNRISELEVCQVGVATQLHLGKCLHFAHIKVSQRTEPIPMTVAYPGYVNSRSGSNGAVNAFELIKRFKNRLISRVSIEYIGVMVRLVVTGIEVVRSTPIGSGYIMY